MPKKERAHGNGNTHKRQDKKRGAALSRKKDAASVEKPEKNNTLEQEVVSAATVPTEPKAAERKTERKRDEQQASAKERNIGEAYRTIEDACERSKHLAGTLTLQRSDLLLSLPKSLPSAHIFRALAKESFQYKELHKNRIAARQGHSNELELIVDGMKAEQLITMIDELDELIGDFLGRS